MDRWIKPVFINRCFTNPCFINPFFLFNQSFINPCCRLEFHVPGFLPVTFFCFNTSRYFPLFVRSVCSKYEQSDIKIHERLITDWQVTWKPSKICPSDNNTSTHNLTVLLRLFIDHLYSVLHDTKLISQNVLRDISAPSHHCSSNRVETQSRAQIKF